MKENTKDMLLSVGMILFFFVGTATMFYSIGQLSTLEKIREIKSISPSYDTVSRVGCGTDSMGLTLRCNSTLRLRSIDENETLYPGYMYVFELYGNNTVHRLVGCDDERCSHPIFKGDNNFIADQGVVREDVQYLVVGVDYIPRD